MFSASVGWGSPRRDFLNILLKRMAGYFPSSLKGERINWIERASLRKSMLNIAPEWCRGQQQFRVEKLCCVFQISWI